MEEVFRRYGDGGPRPDHVEPIACVVSHQDAGGQCEREAVGEVWSLPFCELHGREAELAYIDEISQSVGMEFEALMDAEKQRSGTNDALLDALASAPVPKDDFEALEAAMKEAYPPEELTENIDPDILRFDYEEYGRDTPYDWWCEARLMAARFMREAQSVPILKELELVRERATVQQLLAARDMDRRAGQPVGI